MCVCVCEHSTSLFLKYLNSCIIQYAFNNVQSRRNTPDCLGDIGSFHKHSCAQTDILITPESQYLYRKEIGRGHIMFLF